MDSEKPIIIIESDGGLIQFIGGNIKADVVIIDYDTEGLEDDEISTLINGNEVYLDVRTIDSKVSDEFLQSTYKLAKVKSDYDLPIG